MQAADLPTRFSIPFADAAGAGFIRPIPEASQIGVQAGAASLEDGFPPVCFLPVGAGGTPPWGADFNGLLNQITLWNRWQSIGGPIPYDAATATAIGGYPNGAMVAADDRPTYFYYSFVDDNMTDPNAGGAGWVLCSVLGAITGFPQWIPTPANALAGYAIANATTIGAPGSNATQIAAAGAFWLYEWHWTNFSNTQCPVLTSGGVPTTRGASATADFAALKQMTMLDMRGIGPMGNDTMGGGATTYFTGVPIVSGNPTTAGSILGANLHQLILAEIASHLHAFGSLGFSWTLGVPQSVFPTVATFSNFGQGDGIFGLTGYTPVTTSPSLTGSVATVGGDGFHNTVQRSMLGTWYLRL